MTKLYEWNGERHTIAEWARRLNTTRYKIRTRIDHGARLDADILNGAYRPLTFVRKKRMAPKTSKPTMIDLDGETISLSEASRRTGFDRATLRYRLANGIPLTAPPLKGTADPRARLIVRLRAQGYACEARVLDGEEVLVVREVAR